jgi:hypothetical protein
VKSDVDRLILVLTIGLHHRGSPHSRQLPFEPATRPRVNPIVQNHDADLLEENNMQKGSASNFAAFGFAAVILLPATYAAYARTAETPVFSVSQSVDRADARIAELKANLRLTAEQAKYWPRFEFAYHEIATNRAKSFKLAARRASLPPIRYQIRNPASKRADKRMRTLL